MSRLVRSCEVPKDTVILYILILFVYGLNYYRYGCNLHIAPETLHHDLPSGLMDANETAFVGHGGKYWLSLYYTQVGY